LKEATGIVRTVREIPVVRTCDSEHANYIQGQADSHSDPANANPDGGDAGHVNRPKYPLLDQVNPVKVVFYDRVAVVHDSFPNI
jgi:hypothetical protein